MTTAYDGLDLRDVLCICAVLVAAGAENDDLIQRLCHAHAVEVLEFLAGPKPAVFQVAPVNEVNHIDFD